MMIKKRFLIAAFASCFSLGMNAQNKNVVSAINYMGYYEKEKNADDLIEAKKYIDLAVQNEETGTSAKAWSKRGDIYNYINNSKDPKLAEFQPSAVDEMAKSYQKTIEFDTKKTYPDAKDKLKQCANIYTNRGVEFYNAKDYSNALEKFETAYKLKKQSFNETDTLLVLNCGVAATYAKNFTKAEEYYKIIISLNYDIDKQPGKVYSLLANVYRDSGKNEEYKKILSEGRNKFPSNNDLLIEELNYYINTNNVPEAIKNLNEAIQKDPSNAVLHYNLGVLYDRAANAEGVKITPAEYENYFKQSTASYQKAIDLKPDYFDALFNIGALYFNKAVKMQEVANAITDQKKYEAESAKADKVFRESLPFLEKAEQAKTDDKETYLGLLETLKKLYLMIDDQAKLKAINEKIKSGK